jgi:hypothetical protein
MNYKKGSINMLQQLRGEVVRGGVNAVLQLTSDIHTRSGVKQLSQQPSLVKAIMYIIIMPLKHYATNRKVTGSIPDEVIFLNLPNPSGLTSPLG